MKPRILFVLCIWLWIIVPQVWARDYTPLTLKGKVTCEGKGIPGVVVTDGNRCVQTNAVGEYEIPVTGNPRFVYLSTPAGYLPARDTTIPLFYQRVDMKTTKRYDFTLMKNPKNDTRHTFLVQTDVQVTSKDDLKQYSTLLDDCRQLLKQFPDRDVFGFDCGDIVGDNPALFPEYIRTVSALDIPIYRAIGNHDMDYGGRTFETSYRTFGNYFGPRYYSFNKGKVHYIVLNNCFFVSRDYQYIGYIDEDTFAWLEQDLSYIPQGSTVFVTMHIPGSLAEKLIFNSYHTEETTNIAALYVLLQPYKTHILSGHTHFNHNVCTNDRLMEHNTAAVCGTWWRAYVCTDGTPSGYGVYEVDGNEVKWQYKSFGFPDSYQMRVYAPGASAEYPDSVIANVWNWDKLWKVEWLQDGKLMGEMLHYTGYDPLAKEICSDKERVKYDWISPVSTEHLFRVVPHNPEAKIEIRVTDRFGRVYTQTVHR